MGTKLKYNSGGVTHEIPLTTEKPQGKRLAIHHDDQNFYAPLVSTTDSAASDVKLVFGGDILALSTGAEPVEIIESFKFNQTNPATSTVVTLLGNYGDCGVLCATAMDSQQGHYDPTLPCGYTYYARLVSIVATQPDSTIVGNDKGNKITICGGVNNSITGGVSSDSSSSRDYYYFDSGGGVITDFDCGGNYNSLHGAARPATATTDKNFNRFNPDSYYRYSNLKVNGTITALSFPGYNDDSTSLTSHFTVKLHYAHADSNTYIIELRNMTKKETSATAYRTDTAAITALVLSDKSTGSFKLLSTAQKTALGTI